MPKLLGAQDTRLMVTDKTTLITRRAMLSAFAAATVVAAPTFSNAAGFLRGAGDIRKLSMMSRRTGERISTIYWIDGDYIPEAIQEISYFMRDWRRNETKTIDRRTIDIMAASHAILNTDEPFTMLSGYRSAKTNAMLRRQSRSVAKNSLHVKGQAVDLRLGSRSVRQISKAAAKCNAGGVGRYSRSNFVHMDCGPVRVWGR
jgi:uncharacterized protein YcbK (DUF882 family)